MVHREDGRIILHDMRASPQHTRTERIFQHNAELTCVQYHPTMANIFATSDDRGQVCLRDGRMAFGPLSKRREEGIVHKVSICAAQVCMGPTDNSQYVTSVAKQGVARMARPEASSLTFDSEGERIYT